MPLVFLISEKKGHTTTPGEAFPPFCEKCEDSLRSLLTSTEKMQEMGPAVYRSVPRRLKLLTVYRCHSKVSPFSPVLSRPWMLVRSETWTLDLPHGSPAPYNLSRRWFDDHHIPEKRKKKELGCLCHCAIFQINENGNLRCYISPSLTWRINSETA